MAEEAAVEDFELPICHAGRGRFSVGDVGILGAVVKFVQLVDLARWDGG